MYFLFQPKQVYIPGLTMRQRARTSLNKNIEIGIGGENMPGMGVHVPSSSSDSIWSNLLRGEFVSIKHLI